MRKHRDHLWETLGALGAVAFGAGLLLYPAHVQESVAASSLYCLTALVPSLFPFMVLSSFGVRSGAGEMLAKLFGPVTRTLFRLPAICGATLVLSFFGGYPAGARGISLLLEEGKITEKQAGQMMSFCVAPGAAFVVTFLGCGVLGSLRLGWLLFASVTLSGLILGVLAGLGKPMPEKQPSSPVSQSSNSPLVQSVWDACSAVAKMCGCILLFAGFTAILRGSGIFQAAVQSLSATGLLGPRETAACLSFLLEVTGGTGDAAALGVAPVFYAFGVAFGGLCVHLQVFSFFREFPLSKKWFFLTRFLHGLGAAGIFLVLRRIFPGEAQWVLASSNAPLEPGITASTAAGGLSLLLMCLAFLVYVGRSLTNAKKEPSAPLAPSQKDVV